MTQSSKAGISLPPFEAASSPWSSSWMLLALLWLHSDPAVLSLSGTFRIWQSLHSILSAGVNICRSFQKRRPFMWLKVMCFLLSRPHTSICPFWVSRSDCTPWAQHWAQFGALLSISRLGHTAHGHGAHQPCRAGSVGCKALAGYAAKCTCSPAAWRNSSAVSTSLQNASIPEKSDRHTNCRGAERGLSWLQILHSKIQDMLAWNSLG